MSLDKLRQYQALQLNPNDLTKFLDGVDDYVAEKLRDSWAKKNAELSSVISAKERQLANADARSKGTRSPKEVHAAIMAETTPAYKKEIQRITKGNTRLEVASIYVRSRIGTIHKMLDDKLGEDPKQGAEIRNHFKQLDETPFAREAAFRDAVARGDVVTQKALLSGPAYLWGGTPEQQRTFKTIALRGMEAGHADQCERLERLEKFVTSAASLIDSAIDAEATDSAPVADPIQQAIAGMKNG